MKKENKILLEELLAIEDPEVLINRFSLLTREQAWDLSFSDEFIEKILNISRANPKLVIKYNKQLAQSKERDAFLGEAKGKNSETKWYDDTKDTKRVD